jgi:hypothetical protein
MSLANKLPLEARRLQAKLDEAVRVATGEG